MTAKKKAKRKAHRLGNAGVSCEVCRALRRELFDLKHELQYSESALAQALRHGAEMEAMAMLKSMDEPMMAVRMEALTDLLAPIARLLKGDQFR